MPHRFFSQLGSLVEAAWRRRDYDERAFPEVAVQALADLPPAGHVDGVALAASFLRPDGGPWPPQHPSNFGQPPLRVFQGSRFYIEVLCWLDGTTTLHQHGFSGAFHVLGGSSVHGRYAFRERRRVNTSMRLGDLELQGVELLGRGDTRPILSGQACIHSLFHLERPSFTVVVRTGVDLDAQPQYDYLKPHVAEDVAPRDRLLATRDRLWTVLAQADLGACQRAAEEFVRGADFQSAWHALRAAHSLWGDGEEFARVAGAMREAHGPDVDLLLRVLEQRWWSEHLTGLRRTVSDPDLRFFLALLLNVPDRLHLRRCVAERYGGEPGPRIVGWLRQLTRVDARGRLLVLGLAVPGLTAEEFLGLAGTLAEGGAPEDREPFATVTAGLARSPLRPLVIANDTQMPGL